MEGPTITQLKVMEAYARLGSQKKVAHELNVAPQTVKNHMQKLYVKLGVGGAMEALNALGWVRCNLTTGVIPCGWLAFCSRHEGHTGNHGGFRPLIKKEVED